MEYGCIGERLGHSLSPEIHALLGGYGYELAEVPPDGLAEYMGKREFRGVNVTIPYKREVMKYLDRISPEAAAAGAVNTVVNRDGILLGYNTDLDGIVALIRRTGAEIRGKKVLILGTGGTGRTAAAAVKKLGAGQMVLVSRTGREGAVTYEEAYRLHGDAEILINATPCGMYPDIAGKPADIERFSSLECVIDAVYAPLNTGLVLAAREREIPAESGLYMLVEQAARASEIFTGKEYDAGAVEHVYGEMMRRKQNLVLIGMPGSGKTAAGRKAAELMDREFIDTDELIEEQTGRTPGDIISREGEAYFRKVEAGAVREASAHTGAVIATGGGSVLSRENVTFLRMNGYLVFLDADPGQIAPSPGRPLSDTAEKLEKLYSERRPQYLAAADCTAAPAGTAEDTARMIVSRFKGRII